MSSDEIFFHEKEARCGLIGEIILNRPKALNALSMNMCQRFGEKLIEWQANDAIKAVIVKGNSERAFCAGGDIRALHDHRDKAPEQMAELFWHEYRLNAFIHHFTKPYFAFLHGITMGGGAGVSIHGTYRIATENLLFAMPETKIGFFPDIGASYFLNRCPGYSGLYLGLTGNTIGPAAALELKLLTHIIPDNKMHEFENALFQADKIDENCIKPFSLTQGNSELTEHGDMIDDCFSKDSVDAIITALQNGNDWAQKTAAELLARSPTSLLVAFEMLLSRQENEFR